MNYIMSDTEIKIRVRAVSNFIIFVLVPALKKYKEEGYKLIKTKRLEHNSLTIDSRIFKEYFLSK